MNDKPVWARAARTGPVRKYVDLAIFAIEGLICVIDERPAHHGDTVIVTPADMLERVQALNKQNKGETRAQLPKHLHQVHDDERRGSQNIMECVKEAKHMGDPSDPRVQAYWAKHRKRTGKGFSFSSGATNALGQLPPVPTGKGKRVAAPQPDQVIPTIHVPPRRKSKGSIILDK